MTKSQEAQINRCFVVQALTEKERDLCDGLAYAFRSLALRVAEVCPKCRECNSALRRLEEGFDEAIKAVVRYPKDVSP